MGVYGYAGKVLRVDVGTGESRVENLGEEMAKSFLGGRGFVAKILFDELAAGTDPLSPANKVVMAAGPFSGLPLPSSGKVTFGAKSPLTGGYGDSNMGGHVASEMRYAGYDAIIIEGASPKPVYIRIDDDDVKVLDASAYWGKGCFETEELLKKELGPDFQVSVIGPAGENLVRIACIQHDFGRQAGRTGIGAVLGSKKVKAIAVRGSKSIPVADAEKVIEYGKQMYKACFSKPGFREWTPAGTAGVVDWVNEVGAFPTKNFAYGRMEGYQEINGMAIHDRIMVTEKGCFACPIPCGKYSKFVHGGKTGYVEGPEYETVGMMGGNLLCGDLHDIAFMNYVADDLGIDTISGGSVVGFLFECVEKGVVSKEEVGRDVSWGNADDVAWVLERIARREGIGDVLADGVRAASARWGKGSEDFAIQVKGMELSAYECRYAPAMLLAYMTCDVGAHHNRAWAITYDVAVGREVMEGKAEKVIELQHIRPLFDALGVCRFPWIEIGLELEHYAAMFQYVTGEKKSLDDLLAVSERIWNLTRCFNVKQIPGFGRAYDWPPKRMLEPAPCGPTEGKCIGPERMRLLLDRYYELRGWDENGIPRKETLERLGLDFAAEALGI